MGMSAISSDMAKHRRALLSSFLDAEASASMRLGEVDAVRSAVEAACNAHLPSPLQEPDAADAPVSCCFTSAVCLLPSFDGGLWIGARVSEGWRSWAQGPEASGNRKGAQSLEEFVDLLHSIAELGKQINGMQRPAGLPLPGQALPQEVLQEPEVLPPDLHSSQVYPGACQAKSCRTDVGYAMMKSILIMSQFIHVPVHLAFIGHNPLQRGGEADAVSVEPPKLSSPASESCGDMCGDMLSDLSGSAAQLSLRQSAGSELAEAAEAASSLQILKVM